MGITTANILNEELVTDDGAKILSDTSLIQVNNVYYPVKTLFPAIYGITNFESPADCHEFKLNESAELENGVAYLIGDYFYFFRGNLKKKKDNLEPGIYFDEKNKTYHVEEPHDDDERLFYSHADKITTQDVERIRNAVLNKTVIIFNTPDSAHSKIPDEELGDDILKRCIKRALKNKGVDLDQYKTRFASKNMLFNTKQVLRGDSRLSMLLFDRCVDALNLKYTIVVEEGGGDLIGLPLKDKIVISSQDIYDANASTSKDEEPDGDEDDNDTE